MQRITKLFNTKASSVNEEDSSVSFVISTDDVDRYGEVVEQKSWNFREYLKNPIVLWGHDPSEPENVLGTADTLEVSKDGKSTTARLKFNTAINSKAALIFNLIKAGTLKTVSVGFINHTYNIDQDTPVLSDNDLLEISVVAIPANQNAVALSLKEGTLNTKDAQWLMNGMRKEADLLEAQLKELPTDKKDKSMTDEQAAALLEGQAKLVEAIESLKTENQTLREEVVALKPAEETEAEKTVREAKEAEDAKAKADADAKAEADKIAADAEAARKAEEDAAKGGSNDQLGAADELDDDAELTPELQAQIDAELEALNPKQ